MRWGWFLLGGGGLGDGRAVSSGGVGQLDTQGRQREGLPTGIVRHAAMILPRSHGRSLMGTPRIRAYREKGPLGC